jgi:hypothetical protein
MKQPGSRERIRELCWAGHEEELGRDDLHDAVAVSPRGQ